MTKDRTTIDRFVAKEAGALHHGRIISSWLMAPDVYDSLMAENPGMPKVSPGLKVLGYPALVDRSLPPRTLMADMRLRTVDPIRPPETDEEPWTVPPLVPDRPSASDILFVIALAVIVGILVAWAVR